MPTPLHGSRFLLALTLLAAAFHAGAVEDLVLKGTLAPSKDGKTTLAQVKRVVLIDRNLPQELVQKTVHVKEYPASFDARTGAFEAKGLVAGVRYDLCVECSDGRVIEGVGLAPKAAAEGALPAKGRAEIEKHFYGMPQFSNENRILALEGNPKAAVALVELARTKEFHDSGKGEVIWRVERWDYASGFGAWQPDGTKVLRRFRMGAEAWQKLAWVFLPAWGGLTPGGAPADYVLPDAGAAPGRWPGLKIEQPEAAGAEAKKTEHVEDLGTGKDPALEPAEAKRE
ncbi:MAG: hypothetical protein KIS92_25435 [Planctomycetota bacterium]|nr:hypothetical protein [Planctomycetota bacterium]